MDFLGKQERNHNPSGKHDEGPYPRHDGEKITAQKIFRNAHEVSRLGIDKIPGMEHYGIHPAKASIAGHEPVDDFIIINFLVVIVVVHMKELVDDIRECRGHFFSHFRSCKF